MKFIKILVVLLFLFTIPGFASASPDLEVEVDEMRVHDGDELKTAKKSVSIKIFDDNEEATSVTVNGKKAKTVTDEVYSWEATLSLDIGQNDIEIEAVYGNNRTKDFEFIIHYVTLLVPGLEETVDFLPKSGKLELFNKNIVLTYPKENLLVEDDGELISDESITFEILLGDDIPDDYHYWASPGLPLVYRITADDNIRMLYPGELSFPYDEGISSTLANQLAVWYSPDDNWGDGDDKVLGGITDTSKHTITIPFQFSGDEDGYYAVFLGQRGFHDFHSPDGDSVKWSYSAVMPLWAKGIVESNVAGNNIRRSDWFGLLNDNNTPKLVTRLEFATMIVKGLNLPLLEDTNGIFRDVSSSDEPNDYDYFGGSYYSSINYYEPSIIQYVETAARNGIITGYPGGYFDPMQNLKRQEAAVVLARAANLKLEDDDKKVMESLKKIFADADQIPLWAAPSILAGYKAKLIAGVPEDDKLYFKPLTELSRAEAITMTYQLLKKLKKI